MLPLPTDGNLLPSATTSSRVHYHVRRVSAGQLVLVSASTNNVKEQIDDNRFTAGSGEVFFTSCDVRYSQFNLPFVRTIVSDPTTARKWPFSYPSCFQGQLTARRHAHPVTAAQVFSLSAFRQRFQSDARRLHNGWGSLKNFCLTVASVGLRLPTEI